jgi:hypothetical protein
MRSLLCRATGSTTLRAALAGRARSRPDRTAGVTGKCAVAPDAVIRASQWRFTTNIGWVLSSSSLTPSLSNVLLVPGGEPSAGQERVAVVSAVYPHEVFEDRGGQLAGLFRVA